LGARGKRINHREHRLVLPKANKLNQDFLTGAMHMLHGGARGATADEIGRTLKLPNLTPVELDAASIGLSHRLCADVANNGYELHLANAMWAQAGTAFSREFIDRTRKTFDAELTALDFTNPAGAAAAINLWTSKKTNGRIRNLLTADAIGGNTKLILTNAIYFKGNWTQPFNSQATQAMPWKDGNPIGPRTAPSGQVKVPLMLQTNAFLYVKEKNLAALDIPYQGGDLSMLILLPDDPAGLPDVEKSLDLEKLKEIISHLRREPLVDVSFPKFKFETSFDLCHTLEDMGMRSAFSSDADLSGIDGSRDLYVTDVVHKAYVSVDETGTAAAAATALTDLGGGLSVLPPRPSFTADHPFVFVIRDIKAGTILFLGRLMNPAG
jgi:serpin B